MIADVLVCLISHAKFIVEAPPSPNVRKDALCRDAFAAGQGVLSGTLYSRCSRISSAEGKLLFMTLTNFVQL